MDFNPTDPANTSPRPDAPRSPDSAGFEHELSALQALAEAPITTRIGFGRRSHPRHRGQSHPELRKLPISAAIRSGNTLNPNGCVMGHRDPARREPGRRRARALGGQNSKTSSCKTDVAPRSTCATTTRDFAPRLSDF